MGLNAVSRAIEGGQKTIRHAMIGLALISTLEACNSADGHAKRNVSLPDSSIISIPSKDTINTDIKKFEASLSCSGQLCQSLPAISQQDSLRIEQQFQNNIFHSDSLTVRLPMNTVEYIALHSTEHAPHQSEKFLAEYLQKVGKAHFMIGRNGKIYRFLSRNHNELVQINHIGRGCDTTACASRNRDDSVTYKSIGIEVFALPAQERSPAQYATVKKLLGYFGEKYNLTQKSIFTHTMVAFSKAKGLMRKQDPALLNRDKLGIAPADQQINIGVVEGTIAPNMLTMYKWLIRKKKGLTPGLGFSHEQAIAYLRSHYNGINNSIMLHKQRNDGCVSAIAHLASNKEAWLNIDEIDTYMKNQKVLEKTKYMYASKNNKNKKKFKKAA